MLVDLRLFGFALRRQPVAQLARDAQPWLAGGLVVMVVTGGRQVLLQYCVFDEDVVPLSGDRLHFYSAPLGGRSR